MAITKSAKIEAEIEKVKAKKMCIRDRPGAWRDGPELSALPVCRGLSGYADPRLDVYKRQDRAYADRNTLWNAAEAIEKQWNSQLARRIVLAIPRKSPRNSTPTLSGTTAGSFLFLKA